MANNSLSGYVPFLNFSSAIDILKQFLIILTCMALCFSCISCQKEEASPLAGTAWECLEKGDILVFNDNHSGLYYCKSAHDDVYDEVFSSFDFMYSISGQEISIRVYFTKRVFILDGKIKMMFSRQMELIFSFIFKKSSIRHRNSNRDR